MRLHEKVSCWVEGVVAMTGLGAAAVFTRGLGWGWVMLLCLLWSLVSWWLCSLRS